MTDRRRYQRSEYREGEAPAEPGLRLGRSLALPDMRACFLWLAGSNDYGASCVTL